MKPIRPRRPAPMQGGPAGAFLTPSLADLFGASLAYVRVRGSQRMA